MSTRCETPYVHPATLAALRKIPTANRLCARSRLPPLCLNTLSLSGVSNSSTFASSLAMRSFCRLTCCAKFFSFCARLAFRSRGLALARSLAGLRGWGSPAGWAETTAVGGSSSDISIATASSWTR
eukprot:9489546-Pyramimonas_sp.AAC.1